MRLRGNTKRENLVSVSSSRCVIFTLALVLASGKPNIACADYDVTFTYGGGYFSFEAGDIDPGLTFGHGFLAPGSGDGARLDFWIAPDGIIDGFGHVIDGMGNMIGGGGGAITIDPNYAPGGDDMFLGSTILNEDGVDQYQSGAGFDTDSFAPSGGLAQFVGPGVADGTAEAYGRVFETDAPAVGDWYYVSKAQRLRDVSLPGRPPNIVSIGRLQGIAGFDPLDGAIDSNFPNETASFQVADTTTSTSTTSISTSTITTTTTLTTSTTVAPPVIVDFNKDVTLWAVYAPTGTITPMYSTNLGTMPIEWIPILIFTNSPVNGTNILSFDPPDTNAPLSYFKLQRTFD
jgi:hypothetical protein